MSTDLPTRRAGARRADTRRRARRFVALFAAVVGVLALAGVAGAAASVAQGPRVSSVQVDPEAAVAASGSRLIVTTSQSLADVGDDQVTVTPDTPYAVDTSGRAVGVRFGLPLHDDTEYTVTFENVHSLGGGPSASFTETFRTPPAEVFVLQRSEQGDDAIFRTDLAGDEAVPVYTHPHIEDFRATANHLVVSVRTAGDDAALLVTDLAGEGERALPLPGDGFVTNLQRADRGELIGYTFSDADLGESGGLESVLFTASLAESEADAAPQQVELTEAESRVAEWRFVPDTDSILVLTFDNTLLLAGPTGENATSLGAAIGIYGMDRNPSSAIVERVEGPTKINLVDASEAPVVEADAELGRPGGVIAVPGGGTVRRFAPMGPTGLPTGTTIAYVADDGATEVLLDVPLGDSVVQTCVSPSGRYAAVLVAPDAVSNPYDQYQLPMPERLDTRVVEIDGATEIVSLNGFDISWCSVPPQ